MCISSLPEPKKTTKPSAVAGSTINGLRTIECGYRSGQCYLHNDERNQLNDYCFRYYDRATIDSSEIAFQHYNR